MRLPEYEADSEEHGQGQRQAGGERAGEERLDDQQQAEQLDRHVQLGLAQDRGLESGFHEAGEGALQHDQESQAEQADGHGIAG